MILETKVVLGKRSFQMERMKWMQKEENDSKWMEMESNGCK
jgi:hypothetical protein